MANVKLPKKLWVITGFNCEGVSLDTSVAFTVSERKDIVALWKASVWCPEVRVATFSRGMLDFVTTPTGAKRKAKT